MANRRMIDAAFFKSEKIASLNLARRFHNLFSRRRTHGEWFRMEDGDYAIVDRIERGINEYLREFAAAGGP